MKGGRLIDWIFGADPVTAGEGLESVIEHTWPWPPWVAALLMIFAAVLVVAVYSREKGSFSPLLRYGLAALRILLIGLVLFMMYGWTRHMFRTDLPDVVLVIDDSASMNHLDQQTEAARARILRRLDDAGLSQATRINLAKTLLLEDDRRLFSALAEKYNLKLYFLGAAARARAGDDEQLAAAIASAQADRPASRLGQGLADILEDQRGRPTAAVILLTDGVVTEGKSIGEMAELARRKSVRLFTVGLGSSEPVRDIRLSDLLVDDVVFLNDLVQFDFNVTATGFPGQKVKVELRQQGESNILAEKTIDLAQDGIPLPVRLTHRPQEQGEFEFVVDIRPLPGEANRENNRVSQRISVQDAAIRVLLVQAYPNYEYRFLTNLLGRQLKEEGSDEKVVELTTVLQEADLEYSEQDANAQRVFPVGREELFSYDVLIFGDVNPSFLSNSTMENIADFVKQRGGGVVFIAGPRFTPLAYRNSPLEDLFPVDIATAALPPVGLPLDKEFQVSPTQLGLLSPQMQLGDTTESTLRIWNELPGMYWMLETPDLKLGARVLAEHPTRTGPQGRNLPLISMQFVGAGTVLFHNIDDTRRWRFRRGDAVYSRYWLQTIRFLSRAKLLGGDRTAQITADRETYTRGDSVRLRVRFFDDRQAPAQDDGVAVVFEQEGGRRRNVVLRRDANNRGVFETTVPNLEVGRYRAWVATPTLPGQPPATTFEIRAPAGESARLQMEADDLQHAAERTGGNFYTFDTAHKLLKDLPRGRQVRTGDAGTDPLWNWWPFAALFVTLILSEWLLRKRAGLL